MPDLSALGPHGGLLLLLFAVIVGSALLRRVPVVGRVVAVASWLVLAALLALVLVERQELDPALGRFADRLGLGGQQVSGGETRVRMSPDGHFWVTVSIAGVERRLMVDSGSTLTAFSAETATALGIETRRPLVPIVLNTANGAIMADVATVPELRLGNIVARDLTVVVSPSFGELNVLGMNFLSRLKSWRVEGSTLILVPHQPQAAPGR